MKRKLAALMTTTRLYLALLLALTLALAAPAMADTATDQYGTWTYTTSGGNTTITNFTPATSVTNVAIPNTLDGAPVTAIGNYAFSGRTGLTSITIPSSVTSIGYSAFNGCTGLTSITIPEGVTSIEHDTFANCTGLTSVTIPSSVTSIGYSAFNRCSSLTSVTIPEGVTSIGNSAFYGSGLTSVTIPSSVTSIEDSAFYSCMYLRAVYYEGTEEQWNSSITIGNDNERLTDPYRTYGVTLHTVRFDTQGLGTAPGSQTVRDGGKVSRPADPRETGYTFDGWYGEPGLTTPWVFNQDTVRADTTLYAKWTGVKLDRTSLSLVAGGTGILRATASPTTATVAWASTNTAVATVSNGLVTAHAPGAAVITATVEGRTAFCLVTVSAADHAVTAGNDGHGTALASPSNAAQGATVTLLASPNSGYTFKEWTTSAGVTFADRKSASTTFTMPDKAVAVTATFEQDGGSSGGGGTLYAVTAGNDGNGQTMASPKTAASDDVVTILASPNNGYTFKEWTTADGVTFADATSASTSFTMPDEDVTVTATFEADNGGGGGGGGGGTPASVELDEEALSLKAGETATLTATVSPAGAAVVWASTDPSVASVSPDGTVTAHRAGMAVITATSGGRLAFCVVTVAGEGTPGPGPEVVSIALDRTSMDLSVGDAATLTATVDPAGAAVTWGSSDPGVASVTGGMVTGEKAGMAVVVATAGGRLAFCVVTVVGEDGTPGGGSGGECGNVGFGGLAMMACAVVALKRRG